jgi:hypothetical protein
MKESRYTFIYGPLLYHVGRGELYRTELFFACPALSLDEVDSWYGGLWIGINRERVGCYLWVDNRSFEVCKVRPFVTVAEFAKKAGEEHRVSWGLKMQSKLQMVDLFPLIFGRNWSDPWRVK